MNVLSKQKRKIYRGMRKPRKLKVRRYAACLIYINDYLDAFPGSNTSDKIDKMEIDEIILNSIPNRWSKQAYV